MGTINRPRILLGGLVAGLVLNIIEGVTHGVILVNQDAEMMKRLGLSAETSVDRIIELNVWGFAVGILTMVVYASIRPRYGASPQAAARAGVLTWAGVSALGSFVPGILGIYKLHLTLINIGVELVALILAAIAGAALYKEDAADSSKSSAAGA